MSVAVSSREPKVDIGLLEDIRDLKDDRNKLLAIDSDLHL
jgi:hypothetical protein